MKIPFYFIYQPESARSKSYVMLMSNILFESSGDMNRETQNPFCSITNTFTTLFFFIIPFPHFTNDTTHLSIHFLFTNFKKILF